MRKPSILIIYTGGTIGMIADPESGVLKPFKFTQISQEVPALKKFGYNLSAYAFDPPIDSSNMSPEIWLQLASLIKENYDLYDGFVVLHGTDTMSYTASALSFLLENLTKPVVFTGSQLPINTLRTDGKENLITSVEIAAARRGDAPAVPEVCIYFESKLYRANRTTKHHSEHFDAFRSHNFPPLAEAGIHIHYHHGAIHHPIVDRPLIAHNKLCKDVAILKLFPGISQNLVEAFFNTKDLKGVVMETFGSGNATTEKWFLDQLVSATKRGIIIVNITQCRSGSVDMGRYETSYDMASTQVVSGYDLTTEAAITKLMFLLAQKGSYQDLLKKMRFPIAGEMTLPDRYVVM